MKEATWAAARVQPFYCPYCGEEDFVPHGDEAGRYYCHSCTRVFVLKFVATGLSEST